jgi:hypothetical protein
MVNPVTHEIPENNPNKMVMNIASTKFKTSDSETRSRPEIVNETPKILVLEN